MDNSFKTIILLLVGTCTLCSSLVECLPDLNGNSSDCSSATQVEQKVSIDYGDGSNSTYGIPKDFTMPDLTAVTMCAWVKHSRSQLREYHYSYYLNYKKDSTSGPVLYNELALYTGKRASGEVLGTFIGSRTRYALLDSGITLYNGQWQRICTSWRSSDGKYIRSYSNTIETASTEFQKNYTIPGGGNLLICQRWGPDLFVSKRHCYGHIGGVEIWDYFSDSSNIRCVSNCESVGNLFHFDWEQMQPKGNLVRLNKSVVICKDDGLEAVTLPPTAAQSPMTPLDMITMMVDQTAPTTITEAPGETTGSSEGGITICSGQVKSAGEGCTNTCYVVAGVQGAVILLLMILIGYKFRTDILESFSKTVPGYEIPLRPTVHPPKKSTITNRCAGNGDKPENCGVSPSGEFNKRRFKTSTLTMDDTTTAEDYMTPVSSQRKMKRVPAQYIDIGARDAEAPNSYDTLNFAREKTVEGPPIYEDMDISDKIHSQEVTKTYENVNI